MAPLFKQEWFPCPICLSPPPGKQKAFWPRRPFKIIKRKSKLNQHMSTTHVTNIETNGLLVSKWQDKFIFEGFNTKDDDIYNLYQLFIMLVL